MSNPLKILMILTSHGAMGDTGEPTGVWLEELTTPYYAFADAGAEVTIASIAGGPIPIDPRSVQPKGENDPSVERYLDDGTVQLAVANSRRFDSAMARDYDAVFLPGGHGTMWDLPESDDLAATVSGFLAAGKVVAAVCHGPAGLVSARDAAGEPVVKGKRVAAFTNSEEKAVGLEEAVPFLLETRLRELGAKVETAPDFEPFALRDGTLVTGQNPASATETARLVLEALGQ